MPILSVVVPTHNRSQYAISCIKSVLAFDDTDIQLVVSDTSTDLKLERFLNSEGRHLVDDKRFIYAKVNEPSNLTKNHNDAVVLASGEYVCVIGDDDCITSAAIQAARWASSKQIPVVSQTVSANYAWPDFKSLLAGRGHAARLYVPRKVGRARWRECAGDLDAALARALQGTDCLPRCYHGVVRRDLLQTIKDRTGDYFHGSSPDMSGAVSLACLIERYVEVELPLTIPGASGGSNSGRSAMNTHKGDLGNESQTNAYTAQGWSEGVPRFFAVETVWAHAGLTAISKLRPELVPRFNYALLLALCNLRHPEYRNLTEQAGHEASIITGSDVTPDISQSMTREKWARRKYLLRRAMMPTAANGRKYFANLETIADASQAYENYFKEKRFELGV